MKTAFKAINKRRFKFSWMIGIGFYYSRSIEFYKFDSCFIEKVNIYLLCFKIIAFQDFQKIYDCAFDFNNTNKKVAVVTSHIYNYSNYINSLTNQVKNVNRKFDIRSKFIFVQNDRDKLRGMEFEAVIVLTDNIEEIKSIYELISWLKYRGAKEVIYI